MNLYINTSGQTLLPIPSVAQTRIPWPHVYSKLASSDDPHLPSHDAPSPQQVGAPSFPWGGPHFGHSEKAGKICVSKAVVYAIYDCLDYTSGHILRRSFFGGFVPQAFQPSPHENSNEESPAVPHLPSQAPPSPQQVRPPTPSSVHLGQSSEKE